jgi:amino acid transporter
VNAPPAVRSSNNENNNDGSFGLKRGMGFFPALTSNMLNMVGIGLFTTVPLILTAMGGPQALLGWICGAIIALADGLVWAELGAAMPDTGGSYEYLQKAYGPSGYGRLMGFLFLWQVMLGAPLTAASGGVGFANYAQYLVPSLTHTGSVLVAMAVCGGCTFLLYRDIKSIGTISNILWAGLMLTIAIILWAGAWHFKPAVAFSFPPHAFKLNLSFFSGLSAAALLAMYDYSGYFNVCLIGGEIEKPSRNIPRVVILSITILGVLYMLMSLSIIGVVPWQQAMHSSAVVSLYIEQLYGKTAASLMTVLILWVGFASVFCVLLGYTRVPYAAAVEGHFFKPFAQLHPTRNFPSFSVLFFGVASAVMCLLPLDVLIQGLLMIQIVTWFAAQCIGVVLLRRRHSAADRPFSMPLYPLPVIIALAGWTFIFVMNGWQYMASALALVLIGTLAFHLQFGDSHH